MVVLSCDRVTGDDEEPLAVLEEADVVANILLGQGGHILEHEVHLLEPHTGAEHRKDTSSVAVRVWGVVQVWQEEGEIVLHCQVHRGDGGVDINGVATVVGRLLQVHGGQD